MTSNTEIDKNIAHIDIGGNLDFKRYLPLSDLDQSWGFVINDLGHSKIPHNSEKTDKRLCD